jgi:hypothetical protein
MTDVKLREEMRVMGVANPHVLLQMKYFNISSHVGLLYSGVYDVFA